MRILPFIVAVLPACAGLLMPIAARATTHEAAPAANQIAWFDGSVDEAFAVAAEQHKPLLLYWGAVWCPPCNQLKRTIFQRPEFVARTRDFVPVYLDGDSERAQRWGEYFGIVGYPTVVILAPDRTEITRIPGDLDIERYASVLDIARQRMAPVHELTAQALKDPSALRDDDWRALAYYAWDEDEGRTVPEDQLAASLQKLAAACPPRLGEASSRLLFAALDANAYASKSHAVALDETARAAALARVQAIVSDPVLSRANASDLLWSAQEVVGGLTLPGTPARAALEKNWSAALDRLAADDSLSTMERLATVYGRLSLFRLDHPKGKVPASLVALAKQQVAWADHKTTEPHERQSVVNAATKVLYEAGLNHDAEQLLTAELQRSPAPYYFMLDLADLAQETGDTQKALYWLKRAYDTSVGPATRFQWGVAYIHGLIEMAPDDQQTIQAITTQVLHELSEHPDALYQRTRMRFAKLGTQLGDWGHAHAAAATLKSLHAAAVPVCAKVPASDPDAQRSCQDFLSKLS